MGSVEYVWFFAVGGIVRVSVVAWGLGWSVPPRRSYPSLYVTYIADMPVIEIGSNYAGLFRPLEHHLNLETHQYIYMWS